MATPTPNFGWQLPVPNSPIDANVWGTELNGNLSAQDTQLLSAFTNNIGNTAPVAPILTAGSTWINNTNPSSYIFNVYDGSQWVQMGTIDPVTHTFIPVGSAGMPNAVIFTTSGTYVPSAGIAYAIVDGVGGGGGGGSIAGNAHASGGGSGGYFWGIYTAGAIGASLAVTIGAAGAGAVVNSPGGNGGTTSFGALAVANGGNGCNSTSQTPGFGAAVGTGGLINLAGSDGGLGINTGNLPGNGAAASVFGTVACGLNNVNGSRNATGYGSGGGGANNASGFPYNGGNGSAGIVRIIEYF